MITDDHYKELDQLFKTCLDHDDALSVWEQAFISDFVDKFEEYGTDIRISDKQQAILDRIRDKLVKEGHLAE